jgi:hypothetical protein
MPILIRDLLHFEEVEEVIKIRKDEKAQEYIEKYVISDSLRRNLVYMFETLSGATHKSFNVVGNYGTGKSHFLAFISAILEHPEYRSLVKDEEIAQKAQELGRHYLVVKFELGAAKEVSLRYIFFDQIYQQLLNQYDIEVPSFDLKSTYDNKQAVLDILSAIKAQDPEAGLVVIVDEISDFLKQKSKEEMSYDLALLRELGEVSQDSDFLYIGAMQEHVFTNPKYVDQAESIARINQRYVTVTITKDDVSQVLTNRVLNKDADQQMQLNGLLADHRKYFPNFAAQAERYINLFPIHPYVIEVFELLPYFENRGIIGFAVQNVKHILNEDAPVFITYDRVFDLINATHEIRNQPTVAEVVNVVNTLQAKVDLLDARYREDARKLIKALAVLKLLGGQNQNGATSQELANTLMITPPGKMLVEPEMARDNIERIMKNIREVTVGQYIDYGEGRYFLNLAKIDDYDAIIEQKARAVLVDNAAEIEETFKGYIEAELGLKGQTSFIGAQSIYADTAAWSSHRSFRPGLLVIGRDEGLQAQYGDYRFALLGPRGGNTPHQQNEVVFSATFPNDLIALLIRARAAKLLANDGVHKKNMLQISKDTYKTFGEKYLTLLVTQGTAQFAGHTFEMAKLPSQHPLSTLADVIEHVKSSVLEEMFKEKYPKHPTFNTILTASNLAGEITRALQSLERQASVRLDMNSQGYLASFGAMKDDHFSASSSPACQLVLERINANDKTNKVTPVEDIAKEFEREPWGLQKEMVYLLLGALLFNGYLIFVRQGGARLHANDIAPLLKNGLDFFADIRYLERDKDIDAEALVGIFSMLGLQPGLVRDKDSRSEAVKALRQKGMELKNQISQVRQGLQGIVTEAAMFPDLPWLAIQEVQGKLTWLDAPIVTFAEVSKVADLGKIDSKPEFRTTLKERLGNLESLDGFVNDWNNENVRSGLQRIQQAAEVIPKLAGFASSAESASITELERIAADSKSIYSDTKQLLDTSSRRPLKGKVEQFQQKYDQLYYGLHRRVVGEEAPWGELTKLRQGERYAALNQLKQLPFISSAPFNQMALEIQALERRRCTEFTATTLTGYASCPYCRFPEEGQAITDLPGRVAELKKRLDGLWIAWSEQITSELSGLKERYALLSPAHQAEIEKLERAGQLPEPITHELVTALYELTSKLQAVEVDVYELGEFLIARGSALTEDEMRVALDEYLAKLLKGHDRSLVRFKVVHKE